MIIYAKPNRDVLTIIYKILLPIFIFCTMGCYTILSPISEYMPPDTPDKKKLNNQVNDSSIVTNKYINHYNYSNCRGYDNSCSSRHWRYNSWTDEYYYDPYYYNSSYYYHHHNDHYWWYSNNNWNNDNYSGDNSYVPSKKAKRNRSYTRHSYNENSSNSVNTNINQDNAQSNNSYNENSSNSVNTNINQDNAQSNISNEKPKTKKNKRRRKHKRKPL